ncbi:MAG: hypothetical protein HW401_681 [Parcubacteria group bacterium]|nr:hypothetical protein [Parcubacteria group bacterium]
MFLIIIYVQQKDNRLSPELESLGYRMFDIGFISKIYNLAARN